GRYPMPTPKQMEKLAAEAAVGRSAPAAHPVDPADDLPAEHWDALLRDARADGAPTGPSIRTLRLSEIVRHVLRVAAWLKSENRCLVPANSFAECASEPNPETKQKDVVWFALDESRPLFTFAGIWTEFKGVRARSRNPSQDLILSTAS